MPINWLSKWFLKHCLWNLATENFLRPAVICLGAFSFPEICNSQNNREEGTLDEAKVKGLTSNDFSLASLFTAPDKQQWVIAFTMICRFDLPVGFTYTGGPESWTRIQDGSEDSKSIVILRISDPEKYSSSLRESLKSYTGGMS